MMRAKVVACFAALVLARAAAAIPVRDVSPNPGGINPSLFSESFAFDREAQLTVFTGRGGFRTSESRGAEWRRAMIGYLDARGVEPFANGFCQAPSDPSVLYSPSGQIDLAANLAPPVVFRSADLGERWQAMGSIAPGMVPLDCAVDAQDESVVFVLAFDPFTGNEFLFRSRDSGATWTAAAPTLPSFASFIRTSPKEPGVVYVTNPSGDAFDGIYRSADSGDTFERMPASPALPERLAVSASGALFVITADSLLYRAADDGAPFELVASFGAGPAGFGDIALKPRDASTVYVASPDGGLYRSADGGNSFSPVPGIALLPDGTHVTTVGIAPRHRRQQQLFIGTWRGPYRSDDGGLSFVPVSRTLRGAAVNDLAIDAAGRLMVATFLTQAIYRAQEPGHPRSYDAFGDALTTTQTDVLGEWAANALAVAPADPQRAVVSTTLNGIFSTADGGASWTRAKVVPPTTFLTRTRAAWAPGSPNRVYVLRGNALYRSDDAGLTFTRMVRGGFGAIAVDPTNPDVMYLGVFFGGPLSGLFKSVDGGATARGLGVPGSFRSISIDAHNPQTIYAGNADGGVLRSDSGGATWADASLGLAAGQTLAVATDPLVPHRVYAWIQAAGLFVSADNGATWNVADTGESARRSALETGRATMVVDRVVPGRVYLGNNGVLQLDTLPDDERLSRNLTR